MNVPLPARILSWIMMFIAAEPLVAQIREVQVPIEYRGVRVAVTMPANWAAGPFPIQAVPANLKAEMSSGEYTIWRKDWSWNRSWFRGPLGHLLFDALLQREFPLAPTKSDRMNFERRFDFLNPVELLEYLEAAQGHTHRAEHFRYSLVRRNGATWVRCYLNDKMLNGIPLAESWYVGLTEDVYLVFDLGATREASNAAGERWLKAALYWQNRMIDSFTVTGLSQKLSGAEKLENWEFPSELKESAGVVP